MIPTLNYLRQLLAMIDKMPSKNNKHVLIHERGPEWTVISVYNLADSPIVIIGDVYEQHFEDSKRFREALHQFIEGAAPDDVFFFDSYNSVLLDMNSGEAVVLVG